MNWKVWLVAVAIAVFMSGPLLAGPVEPCPSGEGAQTLAWYRDQPEDFTCAIGALTVKGFDYSSQTIPESAIWVYPYASPQSPSLRFSSDAFYAGAGQTVALTLTYNIDPPPIIIRGFEEEMFSDTPVPPGFVTIATELCVGGAFPECPGEGEGGPLLFLQDYGPGGKNILSDSILFPLTTPVYILGVRHTITLNGGPADGGGSAQFDALGNQAYTVPEPGAFLLLGCGLLSLALLRRRGGC